MGLMLFRSYRFDPFYSFMTLLTCIGKARKIPVTWLIDPFIGIFEIFISNSAFHLQCSIYVHDLKNVINFNCIEA